MRRPASLALDRREDAGSGEADAGGEPPARIPVGLGERAYAVTIGSGLIDRAGRLLLPHLARRRTVVVTDETVAAHHGARLVAATACWPESSTAAT